MLATANFYWSVETNRAIIAIINNHSLRLVEIRQNENTNVFTVEGDENEINNLNNVFRLRDRRYSDYNEYGGFSLIF